MLKFLVFQKQSFFNRINFMFVALSKFVIANEMTEEVKTAFKNRPHLVEDTQGVRRDYSG